mmetsp:Transcript_30338/g.51927  ORF Transcript_30338/g.51927 Transcript_30338/m.51927 type:complete len:207 (-) Transcript_30338:200-820(-)
MGSLRSLLRFELLKTNRDFGCDNSNISGVSNQFHGQETPSKVGERRNENSPRVIKSSSKYESSTKCSGDVTTVLMASPKAEDETTAFNRFLVAKPISHYSSSDGATSRLEESKQKVHRNDKEVSKCQTEGKEVEPKRDVDQEETDTTSEQSNGQNCSRVECITQLSRNDVPCSICSHENGVHLRKDEWRIASGFLQLLLDGGVTFA